MLQGVAGCVRVCTCVTGAGVRSLDPSLPRALQCVVAVRRCSVSLQCVAVCYSMSCVCVCVTRAAARSPYGVATMSRLLFKIIGLFCKRAL